MIKIPEAYIQKLYRNSPIKIFEVAIKDLKKLGKDFKETGIMVSNFYGLYFPKGHNLSYFPKRFILMRSDISPMEKLLTFYHEMGHYLCDKKKCKCSKKQSFLAEYHAIMYCLKKYVKEKRYFLLQKEVKDRIYWAECEVEKDDILARKIMKKVCLKLVKTSFFRECVSLLKNAKKIDLMKF
jgi:hypothetical protein